MVMAYLLLWIRYRCQVYVNAPGKTAVFPGIMLKIIKSAAHVAGIAMVTGRLAVHPLRCGPEPRPGT